jgi:hypothetical protein
LEEVSDNGNGIDEETNIKYGTYPTKGLYTPPYGISFGRWILYICVLVKPPCSNADHDDEDKGGGILKKLASRRKIFLFFLAEQRLFFVLRGLALFPSVVVNLAQQDEVTYEVLWSGQWRVAQEIDEDSTYKPRIMTVGNRPPATAPSRLHASPTSQMTTNRTLKPSPDCSE